MCWGSQIHGGVTCWYFDSVHEAPHSSVRKRTYQAVAGVLRAYRAGVTLGLVRNRDEILDICVASFQALGEVFWRIKNTHQNIGLDDPDLFVRSWTSKDFAQGTSEN